MKHTQLVSYLMAVLTVTAFIRNVPCRVRMTPLKLSNNELQRYIEEANDLLGPDAETDRLIKVVYVHHSKYMETALDKKDMLLEKNKMEAYLLSEIAYLSRR